MIDARERRQMVKDALPDGMGRAHIFLLDYLLKSTSKNEPTTMGELVKLLHEKEVEYCQDHGLPTDLGDPENNATLFNRYRNRVKKSISLMNDLGLKVEHCNGRKYAKYYMNRTRLTSVELSFLEGAIRQREALRNRAYRTRLSSAELSLLTDAVRTCSFLTEEQRESIISRVVGYARQQDCEFAQKQIRTIKRSACSNPKTLDNMKAIHTAIQDGYEIEFEYKHFRAAEVAGSVFLELKLDEGETPLRRMTPVEIVYSDGFYYMIACKKHKAGQEEKSKQATKNGKSKQEPADKQDSGDHFEYRTFRIDRMYEVRVSEEKAAYDARRYYQLNAKTAEAFGQGFLPGGKKEGVNVTLWVRRDKVEILTDRFGAGINLKNKDGGCSTTYRIRECEQFFGWVASLGGNVRILAPSWMREHYRAFLEKQLDMA